VSIQRSTFDVQRSTFAFPRVKYSLGAEAILTFRNRPATFPAYFVPKGTKSAERRSAMASNDSPDWGKFLTTGFEIAAAIGLGCAVGYWIDRKLGSSPWGVVAGTLIGATAGMYIVIKETMRMNRDK
jgi:F0F1-type ATP synthase assembly protein I